MTKKIRYNLKITLAGFLASLAMFFIIFMGTTLTGFAPFNIPPSAAFLYNLGIEHNGYALLLHFSYGTLWSFVLVYTFEEDATIGKAIVLSALLWLFMMLVYSPLIGWGIFGFGYAHNLSPNHPLHIEGPYIYIAMTLFVHFIYGWILGFLNSRFLYNT